MRKIVPSLTWIEQFSIFIVGGLLSAAVDVALTKVLLDAGFWYVAAITIGFGLGLCVNFFYNAKVTFSVRLKGSVFVKYLVVVAANYLLTLLFVIFFRYVGGGSVMLGKILSLPVIAFHSYVWSRFWIYKAS